MKISSLIPVIIFFSYLIINTYLFIISYILEMHSSYILELEIHRMILEEIHRMRIYALIGMVASAIFLIYFLKEKAEAME